MNLLPTIGLVVILGAPMPKDAPKDKATPSIVGEWTCAEFTGGGRTATAEELAAFNLGFEFSSDGTCRIRESKSVKDGTYSLDADKAPKLMDFGTGKGKPNLGIYKIEKDVLTICFTEAGAERPAKFESPAGTRIMLVKFKRVEKKKK